MRRRRPSPQALAVLLALAAKLERCWSHGDDLCRSLDRKPGTAYPILIRLAERGLPVTAWEEDPPKGRPARHRYRISPDGVEYARDLRLEARAAERGAAAGPGTVGAAAGGAIAGVVL